MKHAEIAFTGLRNRRINDSWALCIMTNYLKMPPGAEVLQSGI